jgi:hypothetical protein
MYYRDRAVFDAEYFDFLWELVKAKEVVENKELTSPAVCFTCTFVCLRVCCVCD